ncbi:ABC transporter permease [Virgibacillus necropolis]|uniref:ABC transporter permease n=1 Tax=Virgibacillus necropolis TaxID=163877 RepID=UPI00384E3489
MGNLMKTELYKLRRDRSFWTVLIILFLAAIGWTLLEYLDHDPNLNSGFEVYLGAFAGNNYITRIAPCILAGFFISSEYSMGTMKSITATGNSRMRIFWAKLLVFSFGSIIISLIFPIVATGTGTLIYGFGELPQGMGVGYFVQTIGLLILYAAAFSSIMALFAIMMTDSGKAIGFLIIFFLLFDTLFYFIAMKVSIVEPVFNHSVFKLFVEITQPNVGSNELFKLIFVPIVTYIGIGILGSLVFRKKEIK